MDGGYPVLLSVDFHAMFSLSWSVRHLSAERNRQSAAASRERKKHHIKDLETRAERLSEEVARLQVAEHERVRARLVAEEELQRENENLKREVRCPTPRFQSTRVVRCGSGLGPRSVAATLHRSLPCTYLISLAHFGSVSHLSVAALLRGARFHHAPPQLCVLK